MKKSIRVVMIIQDYHPLIGGAERQLAALAPLLQAQRVEISILTRRYPGLLPYELINGVPVHRLPTLKSKPLASLMFTLSALPLLRRLQPELIHAHGLFSPTTTAVAAKRWLGVPIVAKLLRGGRFGDIDRLRRKPFGQRRLHNFRKQVDAFVVISQEIDKELAETGIPPDYRFFIPNGVDLKRFQPLALAEKRALRMSLGFSNDPLVIYTGRLEAEKRVDQLIELWPAVLRVQPEATLLILGSGAEEARLKRRAGKGVVFLGQVENTARYLQASDIFVLPSATEGLSNAILEAMAAGLPVIATAVGGTPDVITDREHGWLIPPDTPLALQESILTLLGDLPCRNRLGHQGREQVAENYALSTTARRLRTLYEQLTTN